MTQSTELTNGTTIRAEDGESAHLRDLIAAFGLRFSAIAAQYRQSLSGRIDAMTEAAEMDAPDMLAASAHALSGASASIGAAQLASLCRDLETECLANEQVPADWRLRLEQIDHASREFNAKLNALLE